MRMIWKDPKYGEVTPVAMDGAADPLEDDLAEEAGEGSERLGLMLSIEFYGPPADLMRLATAVANWVTEGNLTAQGDATIRRDHGTLEEVPE